MEVKKESNLPSPETVDSLYMFYKYLLEHDISFNEYADNLRLVCKTICAKKKEPFVDLDQEVDSLEDSDTLPEPKVNFDKERNMILQTPLAKQYDPEQEFADDMEEEGEDDDNECN